MQKTENFKSQLNKIESEILSEILEALMVLQDYNQTDTTPGEQLQVRGMFQTFQIEYFLKPTGKHSIYFINKHYGEDQKTPLGFLSIGELLKVHEYLKNKVEEIL